MAKPLPSPTVVHTVVFDFDGVFTDNKVWVDQRGGESVRCDRSDGLAFDLIRAYVRREGLRCEFFILSKEPNPVVLARAQKLGLDCHHGIRDKLAFLQEDLHRRFPDERTPLEGVVYLGNDLNDLRVMRRAGYTVAPADAHPRVQEVAHLVLEQRGGEGFVRAFVEQWLGIDRMSLEELDELVSDS